MRAWSAPVVVHPQFTEPDVALREAGLRRVNVSLDTLDPERFKALTRTGDHARVLDGVEAALKAGYPPEVVADQVLDGIREELREKRLALDKLGKETAYRVVQAVELVQRFLELEPGEPLTDQEPIPGESEKLQKETAAAVVVQAGQGQALQRIPTLIFQSSQLTT